MNAAANRSANASVAGTAVNLYWGSKRLILSANGPLRERSKTFLGDAPSSTVAILARKSQLAAPLRYSPTVFPTSLVASM